MCGDCTRAIVTGVCLCCGPVFAQNSVVIRLAPEAELVPGSSELLGPAGAVSRELGRVLESVDASAPRPAFSVTPARRDLARQFGLDRFYLVDVPAGANPQLLESLGACEGIVSAEIDPIGHATEANGVGPGGCDCSEAHTPNDEFFDLQYPLYNTISVIPGEGDINAINAWSHTTGSSERIIAILDAGVSHSHPDLTNKLWPGANFGSGPPDYTDDDTFGHGTLCAGIAAASANNGIGIAGVDWRAWIMPVRTAEVNGTTTASQIADGIVYAADNLAQVINISYGLDAGMTSTQLETAVQYAEARGVVIVASAGNNGAIGPGILYPAAYPDVIAVGATDEDDDKPIWSSYGPGLSVVAPGKNIVTTCDVIGNENGYAVESGTSFAAPHVAGTASLILSVAPWLSPAEVRTILETTAEDLGTPGWDEEYGWGRIDARAAVEFAATIPSPCFADLTTQGAGPGDPLYGVPDGQVNAGDLNYYINAYVAGDTAIADLTTFGAYEGYPGYARPDGQLRSGDIQYYVSLWVHGCDSVVTAP